MVGDKRLETMSEEIKLLKGELKQSLASVRDYLLNMELPSSELASMLDALDNGEGQKVVMSGSLGSPRDNRIGGETREEVRGAEPYIPEEENLIDVEEPAAEQSTARTESSFAGEETALEPEESYITEEEPVVDSISEIPDETEEIPLPESELPLEEELPEDFVNAAPGTIPSTPKVNMLANLITWVARIKKEIGYERLPTLLEVYGISGHLSSELKDIIIQLAEITGDKPEVASEPALWSQAILSLHGILTGGDAPLHPIMPFMAADEPTEEETAEEEKPEEAPYKLKLVLPGGNGKEKEFTINLTPQEEDNKNNNSSSAAAPGKKKKNKPSSRER